MFDLNRSDSLAVAGILVAIIVAFVTWIITWLVLRAQTTRKQLSYSMKTTKIISSDFLGGGKKLEITYDGEHIHDLILLVADIKNTGNVAIENIDIVIENNDATYMIPGYIEDTPPGYENLWSISRTDAEQCTISLDHINPGQVAKVRLIMDVVPKTEARLVCPVPNLKLRRVSSDVFPPIAVQILSRLITSL